MQERCEFLTTGAEKGEIRGEEKEEKKKDFLTLIDFLLRAYHSQ